MRTVLCFVCIVVLSAGVSAVETFDTDPGWDGFQNRPKPETARRIEQQFGFDAQKGIGGIIAPDGNPAYYAKALPAKSFNDVLSASGTLRVAKGGGNILLGFFNHSTVNEWRTPNSLAFRVNGRGDFFHVHVEYCTARWRAGATVIGRLDTAADRVYPLEIPSDAEHTWSLRYDPASGQIEATFDRHKAVCTVDPDLRADGASFDRFGLLNVVKSADSPGEFWMDKLEVCGERVSSGIDPQWEGLRNHATYLSEEVRPRFNFGYSATQYAGGDPPGEIGGLFFRGDCRYGDRMAFYGARLAPLALNQPLHVSGKIVLRRAVSDSTTLFGFFHAQHSMEVHEAQNSATPRDFLGFAVEGPSSEGFYVYPVYRNHGDGESHGYPNRPPRIYPDGKPHSFVLDYDPKAGSGRGEITFSLDGQTVTLVLGPEVVAAGAHFDRLGLVTPWIDGNGQGVYFDDLDFTGERAQNQ